MAASKRKNDKIACPEIHYLSSNDIVKDHTLSHEEKRCTQHMGTRCPPTSVRWPRLSEQISRIDKWSVCRV